VRIKIGKVLNEEIIEGIVKDFQEIAQKLPAKARVLIDLTLIPHVPASFFRKDVVRILKRALQDTGFEKAALWGAGIIQKTVSLFIIATARVKSLKHFQTEKEAIRWLKEE
jgi:hypothetical protein